MEDGGGRNQKSPELVMTMKGNTLQNRKTHQLSFFLKKNSKDIPLTKAIQNVLARGAPPLLRSLLAVL